MEKTTGQIIKEQRVKKRLTQAALAEQLNVTDKAVSKWERDISRPDIGLIPKISEILEIPAELLLNIPLTPQEAEDNGQKESRKKGKFEKAEYTLDDEDAFDEYVFHKAVAISLLKKGALGFAGGILFTLITALSDNDPFHIGFAMAIGLFTSGIPYGWQLLERIIGSWFVVGSIPIMLLTFIFKLAGTIMIGWFTYPVALFYHLFKSQRKGSTARKVYMGLFAGTIALIAIFLLITCWPREKKQLQVMEVQQPVPVVVEESQNTQPEESKIMIDASYFHPTKVAYCDVVENAMGRSLAAEEESRASGDEILEQSSIKSVYFLTMKEPGTTHYDYGDDVTMVNVLLVVASYKVNILNTVQRENWTVYAYPNFTLDVDGQLTYSETDVYDDSLLMESREDVYNWICDEYEDMIITELVIPV